MQTSPEQPGSSYSQQDVSRHQSGDESNQDLEAATSCHCSHGEMQIPVLFGLEPCWQKHPTVLEKSPTDLEKHPIETAGPSSQDMFQDVGHLWGPEEGLRSSSQAWLFPMEVTGMQ